MPGADHGADPVQSELITDLLKEKIPAIKTTPFIHGEILSGRELDLEYRGIFLLRFVHQTHLFLCPCFGIRNTISFTDVFFGTEAFHNHGFIFTINIDGFLYIIRNRIFCLCPT